MIKIGSIFIFLFFFFCSAFAQRIDFYVSPSGNDTNIGSIDQPFATLEKARDALYSEMQKSMSKSDEYIIYIRGGKYQFDKTVMFHNTGNEFSAQSISIKNYQDEKVIFTGGVNLPVSGFSLIKDEETLKRLRPEAIGQIWEYDLIANNIPYDSALIQHGFGTKEQPSSCTLYFNKELQQLGRWPNEGTLEIGDVIDPGSKPRWEKPPYRGAIFEYDYDRAENWANVNNTWIYGVFSNGYSDDNLKIKSFDTKQKIITTIHPHTYGVFSNEDISTWDLAHARQLRGYYVYNLLEEIDLPGEYFLDRKTGKLYLWPPYNMENAEIELTKMTEPFFVFYNTSNISVSGIQFESSRGMGIFMNYTENISIQNCVFRNLSLVGISTVKDYGSVNLPKIKNYVVDPQLKNHNLRIENCKIYNTGSGGINLDGGDRTNLISGNNVINNCEIYNFSKIRKTNVKGITLRGVGNTISHCYIHDALHTAIHLYGNNHLLEYNHIQNVCTNTSDAGAVYAGRNPSAQGTIIRFNFFDSIIQDENLVCAVYLDDGTCGYKIAGNIFYHCGNPEKLGRGFGAFHINGGYGNYMDNNIFIECKRAYGSSPWNDKKWIQYLTKGVVPKRLKKVNINSEVYQQAYPMLKNLQDTINFPLRINYTSNDVVFRCKEFTLGSYQSKGFLETTDDPGFVDLKNKNFTLKPDSEVFEKLPGFRAIPFHKIGLIRTLLNNEYQ